MNQVEVTITLKAILPEGTDLPKRLNYVLADALSEYMTRRIGRHGPPNREDAEAYVAQRYEGQSYSWRANKVSMVFPALTWASALRNAALQMGPATIAPLIADPEDDEIWS